MRRADERTETPFCQAGAGESTSPFFSVCVPLAGWGLQQVFNPHRARRARSRLPEVACGFAAVCIEQRSVCVGCQCRRRSMAGPSSRRPLRASSLARQGPREPLRRRSCVGGGGMSGAPSRGRRRAAPARRRQSASGGAGARPPSDQQFTCRGNTCSSIERSTRAAHNLWSLVELAGGQRLRKRSLPPRPTARPQLARSSRSSQRRWCYPMACRQVVSPGCSDAAA